MALEKFHYTIGKTKITLPHMANLPSGVARKSRKTPDEAIFIIFETLFEEGSKELDAIDTLDGPAIAALMEAWQQHSGVELGESTAS